MLAKQRYYQEMLKSWKKLDAISERYYLRSWNLPQLFYFMLKSTLFDTLKLLATEELNALDKFVHSRYFYHEDNASGVIALFEAILPYAPDFSSEDLERSKLGKKIEQSPEYVMKLASNLHNIVRKFIAFYFNENQKDDFWQQLTLLRFYAAKNVIDKFELLAERMNRDLYENKQKEDEYFLQKELALNNCIFEFQIRYNPSGNSKLVQTIKSLDTFYYFRRLRLVYFSIVINQNNLQSKIDTNELLHDIEMLSQKKNLLDLHAGIFLFYQAILLFSGNKKGNFDKFSSILSQKGHLLSTDDQFLLNGLVRQLLIQKRDNELNSTIFATYKHHLYKRLLFVDNKILAANFRNIIRYGVLCNQLKWVEKFIKIHENKLLGTQNPKEVVDLSKAYLYCFKKDFAKAELYLSLDLEDIINKVDARKIQLMIQYETRFINVDTSVDAFRKFIANAKNLPEVHKEANNNFALTFRKLLNPNLKRNDKKIDKLIEEINKSLVSESGWLIEKLKALKTRK